MFEKEFEDEFSPFLGLIVEIRTEKHDLPLYGRVKAVSPDYVTIEKKDGRTIVIKKKVVLEISAVRNQSGPRTEVS
jgi:RNase P/RNase MRP subunit p29